MKSMALDGQTPALDDVDLRMSYRIGRGEQGVLSFEPYKTFLLPFWRFKTPEIAAKSSEDLWARFVAYGDAKDFVGMDMTRKYIQMGMTRAKRYANYKGGRKYRSKRSDSNTGAEEQFEKSDCHEGRADKLAASEIFREKWLQCKADEKYMALKDRFMDEQKAWKKSHDD